MKKCIVGLGIFFSLISSAFSQEFSYGLKGGVNYSMGGQITGESSGVGNWDETIEGTPAYGFHGGVFGQVNFGKFFIRPEVVYTSLELDFEFPEKTSTYSVQKFDIPLMIGYNVWGPLDIFAGPSYSNILDSALMGNELEDPIVVQNTPINAQIGAKVEFGRFGIDVRYEHSLSNAEVQNLDIVRSEYGVNRAYFDDARINQLIVGVIFKIGGPGLNERRRRACY
ncbi:porin family protein [Salinimicrobium oceani]|uniref:PorT family protein n=1 Tax=Salinimicrobium oceani TaxID=2722702 RepID=A0ABX1D1H6_9FLAO|nr:porin family protein [Salinimicrobium oceani]NJW53519.1 PorT family protein [Salinimicrobium oceani]